MTSAQNHAVLLLAYGSPETLDDVEGYFTHIRGGRPPSAEAVADLRHRYALVGGRTPLLDITRALGDALEQRSVASAHPDGGGGVGSLTPMRVYVGMKHWHPFIGDTMARMAADGIRRVTVLVLAPHYSRMSVGGYRRAVDAANASLGSPFAISFVDSWHLAPEFIALMVSRVREALETFHDAPVTTVFSAHSLPVRIRAWNDPYEAQLMESCRAVAEGAGLAEWRFAWQSAGNTGEPWLGPDICEYLELLANEGVRRVLSCPIGFTCDHLEVLYDIDREATQRAASLGIELRRTRMPNASAEFVAVIHALVTRAQANVRARAAAPVS